MTAGPVAALGIMEESAAWFGRGLSAFPRGHRCRGVS